MARAKKSAARPRRSASGFENDSSTATSPSVESVPMLEDQIEAGAATAARTTENAEASSQQAPSSQQTPFVSETAPIATTSIKRSWVWEHFKEYDKKEKVKDAKGNIVEIIVKRAHCIYCPRGVIGDFAVSSSRNGTSGMLRHINNSCRYYPPNVNKSQKVLVGDKFKGNQMSSVAYDQEDYLEACVEMIVIDELPFSFVEKKGFNRFCMKVCPLFDVPSRRKLCREFLSMYESQKKQLKKSLKHYRVCLTTDTWTSVQNINYMVLTAHFIDSDWKMHKRVINFCVIQNHQGSTIGRLIEACLLQWQIEKVMTITVDNAAANKSALEWLIAKLNNCSSYEQILGGKYMHVRCTAHITNLIVGYGLKRLQRSVIAIRNAVKFVRSSPNRLESFKKAVVTEKLPCKGLVCLDVPTRWNSTYLMLEAALKFKKAFARMEEDEDRLFLSYFGEPEEDYDEDGQVIPTKNTRNIVGPPAKEDWEKAGVFVELLRVFYDVTLRVSASLHLTVHTTFHDVITMENNIDSMFVEPEMATGSETENVLLEMAANMRAKYDKYYGSFMDMNHLVIVGLVLDARFKLKNVTHMWEEAKLNEEEVKRRTSEIKNLLLALYDQYVPIVDGGRHMQRHPSPSSSTSTLTSSSSSRGSVRGRILNSWKIKVAESAEAVVLHEVDQYLESKLEPTDDEDCFDILSWWKLNGPKFPVLAAIARDVLAIQTSTVASESCFSTGGRVIDQFRSSLTPKTVEGLICMQNWLLGDDNAIVEDEPTIENYEFYERVELDYESSASSKNACPAPLPQAKGKGKGKGKAIVIDV